MRYIVYHDLFTNLYYAYLLSDNYSNVYGKGSDRTFIFGKQLITTKGN